MQKQLKRFEAEMAKNPSNRCTMRFTLSTTGNGYASSSLMLEDIPCSAAAEMPHSISAALEEVSFGKRTKTFCLHFATLHSTHAEALAGLLSEIASIITKHNPEEF